MKQKFLFCIEHLLVLSLNKQYVTPHPLPLFLLNSDIITNL